MNNSSGDNNLAGLGHTIRNLLAHLLIITSLVVLVCFVTDRINPDMEFVTSTLSRWVIGFFSVLALINGICTVVSLWRRPRPGRRG